jgi:Zn-dependent peptidase ImmA (M78 family)/transcriptional regulator with XRE-family HTH domain
MPTAQINHRMLTWARERSGFSLPVFAGRCSVDQDRLLSWESGDAPLTFAQAQKFASKAHVPFGFLFLREPPHEALPIPDLRTLENRGVNRPSAELLDLLKLTLYRQQWYKDYLNNELVGPCSAVGRLRADAPVGEIVADMRRLLNVPDHPVRGNWEDYYRDLVARIEARGVLVMRESYFGHHTRPLRVDEFRGFAIADPLAPVVFVNHADAPGARLFTLIHELCHIWTGISGVSDSEESTHLASEVTCNAVAAEFLVPANEFRGLWVQTEDWRENLAALEAQFHVSSWTLARRALTLGYISTEQYQSFVARQGALWAERVRNGETGPGYHTTKNAQLSKPFSRAVLSQAFNGQILLREAGQLLGINPAKLQRFAEEVRL